ncbi:MAG: ScyD/ScyE family protein [Gemmataceae bacterium]|nr:ScyD/ScyE family protein [Gemmataceae bacterium]
MKLLARLLSHVARRARPSPATRRSAFVPRIEALEGREVPAHVLASGLDGLFGSTVGPDGNLYVTEQIAGKVSRINPRTGQVTTFASGLPADTFYAGLGGGAMDVAFLGNTAYVLVAAVGPEYGGTPGEVIGIYRVDGPSSYTVVADLGTWSRTHLPPPDFEIFDPNGAQYAMQPYRGGFLVTDGHHNRVLQVSLDGHIDQLLQFGNVVPTGLEVRGNTAYLTQAGPVPHTPETGKVLSFTPGSSAAPTLVASGAALLVDVEFGPGNTLYALSQGHWSGPSEGYPADPNTGSLVRANRDGTFTTIETGLDRPTSLEIIGNTAYVLGLGGEVVTIDLAGPQAIRRVNGSGRATLTAPGGQTFGVAFGLTASREADGDVGGIVNFSFGPAFGQAWGAVPGVDRIQLHGRVTAFTVAADGTVTLTGRLTERDFSRGRLVFVERDIPFRITLRQGSNQFTFQWCELPTFYLNVTAGELKVR